MQYDIVVIGGGIIGMASALQILQQKPRSKICVLEKERELALHQSGHNSGVIHSGIYYRPSSLKAENCRKGYQMLVSFCEKEGIPYELCGKIIIATNEREFPVLYTLLERGKANGLKGLKELSAEALQEYEPYVSGLKGIFVPQTGIVDYKVVTEKYAEKVREKGGVIFMNEKVINILEKNTHSEIITENKTYWAKLNINCSGLYSDKIASMTQGALPTKIIPFRGEYYQIRREKSYLVKNLIYPVPDPSFPFLGVHFTRMIGGGVEAGPNAVLAYGRESYKKTTVNLQEFLETLAWPGFRKIAFKYWQTALQEMYRSYVKYAFTKALQKLIPEIEQKDLVAGGAGVRAQACDIKGNLLDDFVIFAKGRSINVCNAPSPAATSSLAIGSYVAKQTLKHI